MKSVRKAVAAAVFGLVAATGSVAHAAGSPGVEHNTQAFLQALEAGGGKPIEQLSPQDARAVLSGAQAGERFIVSNTSAFKELDSIRITQ